MSGGYLTVAEVADRLRVSKMSVYRWMESGALGHARVGRTYRIPPDAVTTFLAARTVTPGMPDRAPLSPEQEKADALSDRLLSARDRTPDHGAKGAYEHAASMVRETFGVNR